jgi:hypothetical protein
MRFLRGLEILGRAQQASGTVLVHQDGATSQYGDPAFEPGTRLAEGGSLQEQGEGEDGQGR